MQDILLLYQQVYLDQSVCTNKLKSKRESATAYKS
uniref:Uncharacterized protein n=1 Tax=Arundo donax TaxID=35708 RepID=A0A0A9B306_ARUDO